MEAILATYRYAPVRSPLVNPIRALKQKACERQDPKNLIITEVS